MTAKLLDALGGDYPERRRWLVCGGVGIVPGSPGWLLMTRRRVLRLACHLALDARETGRGPGGAESGTGESFDLERFRELGGGR